MKAGLFCHLLAVLVKGSRKKEATTNKNEQEELEKYMGMFYLNHLFALYYIDQTHLVTLMIFSGKHCLAAQKELFFSLMQRKRSLNVFQGLVTR